MAANFNLRIVDLIGDYAAKINDNHEQDLLNAAISEVADSVPPELLIKYAKAPQVLNDGTRTWTAVEGKKVLLVTRRDAAAGSNGVHRNCELVGIPAFNQSQDEDSIYLATKHSPVTCITTSGGQAVLDVKPTVDNDEIAHIYYFEYPTGNLKETADADLNAAGIPNQLFHAIALRASINMLQAYISDSVQDDEDTEILSMLTAQIGSLTNQYKLEMGRFTNMYTEGEASQV